MDIIFSFAVCFALLITSVLKGIFVGYPLFIALIIFGGIAMRRGYNIKSVLGMIYKGGKKSFVVLQIFVLIGAITSAWMSSGTVPAIVYYGIKFLNPKLFLLSVFLVSSLVSFLIGTSFGTVGTAGIALMVMAKGGGVDIYVTAGAILSGAYFGDRCSPMSSSANLVAGLTNTNLYTNIKNMLRTSVIPFIITLAIYLILSMKMPLRIGGSSIGYEIDAVFKINIITLLPAAIILVFSMFKSNVKRLMIASAAAAVIISILLQGNSIYDVVKHIIFGFEMKVDSPLKNIIKGGGILSMLKVAAVVFISSAFTGIFEGTGMLNLVEKVIEKANTRFKLFFTTVLTSIAASAFGCTQALAVILTHLLMNKAYENRSIDKSEFATDIENTAIVIAPLIPWNIAVLVPLITLGVGIKSILFCFYLFLIPAVNLLFKIRK